jgi:hypothetical protein
VFSNLQSIEAALALGWTNLHNPFLVALLLPILGLTLNVLSQVVLLRLARGRGFMRTIALGFFLGGLLTFIAYPLAAWYWCSPTDPNSSVPTLLLEWIFIIAPAYCGLGYGYANFANLGNSSIRIRLYEELLRCADGRPLEDIRQQYNETAILKTRLQRLSEGGDLLKSADRWKTGRSRFVFIGGTIFFAKRIVLQRQSEFDSPAN